MNFTKKTVSILLALVFVFSSVTFAFAEDTKKADESDSTDVIRIETETNKNKYRTSATAKITVTVTNEGDKPLFDVHAQAIFNELKPVNKKSSTTAKSVGCLQPGDSFTFSYKTILNIEEFDVNIFSRLTIIFMEFFKGAYFIESEDNTGKDTTVKKQTNSITFGKFKAENLVEVSYSTKEKKTTSKTESTTEDKFAISSDDTLATTTTTTTTTTEEHTERTTRYYDEYEPTRPQATEPRTTRPHTTEPRTTKPRTTWYEPTTRPTTTEPHFDNPTYEERAYSEYIEFLRENSSVIGQCDAADINGDGIYELLIEDYQGSGIVYTYNDQYGIYELHSEPRGKSVDGEMYYSVKNQLVIFPTADTGGETYTTVHFTLYDIAVTSELVYNNGKYDTGCFRNGVEISRQEYDSTVNSYANQYYYVDGNPEQLIGVLEGLI